MISKPIMLAILGICLTLFGFSPVHSITPEELIREHGEKIKYQAREGNRFEGIKPRLHATSSADLVSVSLKPAAGFGDHLPEFLYLVVPLKSAGTEGLRSGYQVPEVTAREPKLNYWLDHMKFTRTDAGDSLAFHLKTDAVLKSAGIAPGALQLLAEDYNDLIYPVIVSPSEKHGGLVYEFGVYAEERHITLKSFSILSFHKGRRTVFSLNTATPIKAYELITISWDGTSTEAKSIPPGNYIVEFDGEVSDNKGTLPFRSPSYQFRHNPDSLVGQ